MSETNTLPANFDYLEKIPKLIEITDEIQKQVKELIEINRQQKLAIDKLIAEDSAQQVKSTKEDLEKELTMKEVAKMINRTVATVKNYKKEGINLPFINRGRRVYCKKRHVLEYLEQNNK